MKVKGDVRFVTVKVKVKVTGFFTTEDTEGTERSRAKPFIRRWRRWAQMKVKGEVHLATDEH